MSADGGTLPAPSSGLFLEVSFRRLLASCQDIISGDDKGREDLKEWRRSPVFHHVSCIIFWRTWQPQELAKMSAAAANHPLRSPLCAVC